MFVINTFLTAFCLSGFLLRVAVCQCFRCDSIRCIPREAICDGASDCSDGTDEIDCSNSAAVLAVSVTLISISVIALVTCCCFFGICCYICRQSNNDTLPHSNLHQPRNSLIISQPYEDVPLPEAEFQIGDPPPTYDQSNSYPSIVDLNSITCIRKKYYSRREETDSEEEEEERKEDDVPPPYISDREDDDQAQEESNQEVGVAHLDATTTEEMGVSATGEVGVASLEATLEVGVPRLDATATREVDVCAIGEVGVTPTRSDSLDRAHSRETGDHGTATSETDSPIMQHRNIEEGEAVVVDLGVNSAVTEEVGVIQTMANEINGELEEVVIAELETNREGADLRDGHRTIVEVSNEQYDGSVEPPPVISSGIRGREIAKMKEAGLEVDVSPAVVELSPLSNCAAEADSSNHTVTHSTPALSSTQLEGGRAASNCNGLLLSPSALHQTAV